MESSRERFAAVLALLACGVLFLAFSSPLWWVSLKAPNYPADAFPDGVRIHFHVDGTQNGCELRQTAELDVKEALDCVHEMDTINHYVGMYPIASGAPVERLLSKYLFLALGSMVLGWAFTRRRSRLLILGAGFVVVAILMMRGVYGDGGAAYLSPGYIEQTLHGLDIERAEYDGYSGLEISKRSFGEALGRYFRNPEIIADMERQLENMVNLSVAAVVVVMLAFFIGVAVSERFAALLLLAPMLLPVFFVADYAGWLWWFGHHMNEMGAFTVKPFMPTVFGVGKVAQFSTFSYPYYGFGLMVLFSALLAVAGVVRRRA